MSVNDSDHTEHLLNGVGNLMDNLKSGNKENDVPTKIVKETRTVAMPSLTKFKVLGEDGSRFRPWADDVQDFYKIRDSCLASGQLFEDSQFDAVESSLSSSKSPSISKSFDVKSIKWKRPTEIVNGPQFFVKGATRFDVQQGKLGDCWLLAAVANLTSHEHLFQQVVPNDQSFQDNYAGIFHFRFWQYGEWVDVVIDDRLPTYYGELVFLHSKQQNEFWSALLEKAYAKLYGSYEALKGGSASEALEDFTGGVTEFYNLRDKTPSNLFKIMEKAHERSSLMGCSIYPDPNAWEARTSEGLVRGHAYSITEVKLVDITTPTKTGKIPLLRIRNPWGDGVEWNGVWSDKSPEWQYIPETAKQEMGLTFSYDGEFWMSYRDFTQRFDQLDICNLSPDSLLENMLTKHDKKKWEMSVFEGEWVRGATAGGCRVNPETFWHNPQYIITLTDPDEKDEEDKCTVLVALMQKNRRKMGAESLHIGFAVYHMEDANNLPKPLDLNFFKYNACVAETQFIKQREVTARFKLPPGVYCIVPSTFDPNEEGEFLLRVFSETKNYMFSFSKGR
ncbi:calpain-A isoform X2 [Nilaparvata lugens]|uniref:calpain-A isoform X2 n=1 Tax=Nilaparvata lugens TaxID=108931 RepID=UPI00193D79A6|nr:calpain-A isoform X2 [Nilaparvata lugens]